LIDEAAQIYFSWLKRVPTSLKQLGPGDTKIANATAADLINSDLASGVQDGYRFTITANKAGWTVRAVSLTDTKPGFHTTYAVETRLSQPSANRKSATSKQ
jgi:hypothetical protein